MHSDERTLWNQKYQEGSHSSPEPDSFLIRAYSRFMAEAPPGNALDVAGGAGRNALWLAQRGWMVKLIDVSDAAITLTNEHARRVSAGEAHPPPRQTKGRIETQMLDLNAVHDLGQHQYDLVLVFFYLQRELFPAIRAALKPGGLLVFKTYTVEQRRLGSGPHNPDYLLQPLELREAFQSMHILHYVESVTSMATAELVARKMSRSIRLTSIF